MDTYFVIGSAQWYVVFVRHPGYCVRVNRTSNVRAVELFIVIDVRQRLSTGQADLMRSR